MEKINELLAVLENTVPQRTKNRLDKLANLKEEQTKVTTLQAETPSDENVEYLAEIAEAIEEMEEDLVEELEALIEKKQQVPPTPPVTDELVAPIVETKKEEKEDESGVSIFGLVFGGILLVASVGAINYFRKK